MTNVVYVAWSLFGEFFTLHQTREGAVQSLRDDNPESADIIDGSEGGVLGDLDGLYVEEREVL